MSGAALCLLLAGCAPQARPDLVLVSLDTLRADHLSLYGYPRPTSPRLDRFAADHCRVFERSLSSSTWTLPSHATMFTGLLPAEHGLASYRVRLPRNARTVAELLRGAGYATSAVTDGGFLAPVWGLERGFERYADSGGETTDAKNARAIFEKANVELERLRAAAAPFFLFVHSYEVHQPYDDAEGFAAPFLDPGYRGELLHHAESASWPQRIPDAPDLRRMIDLYDGEIRRLDHYLGGFLDRLSRTAGARASRIVITSDHGEAFGEHGTLEHGLGRVEDENVRVPLLFCDPEGSGGERARVRTSTLDVAPTLLDLARTPPATPLLGRSLRGLRESDRRWVVSHGFGSFLKRNEEWLRVEGDPGQLVVDLQRRSEGGSARFDEAARERALVVLARGRGADRLVLLPRGLERLRWALGAGFRVVSRLDDGGWASQPVASGQRSLRLDRATRSILLLRGLGARHDEPLDFVLRGVRLSLASPPRAEPEEALLGAPLESSGPLNLLGLAGGFPGAAPRAEAAPRRRRAAPPL